MPQTLLRRRQKVRLRSPWLILLQEDRGGNSVDVRFDGRKENLHSLWDTALVELEQGTAAEIAARMQAVVTDQDRSNGSKGHRQIGR